MSESPFAFDISGAEGRRRRLATSGDLLTDELGLLVSFRGEDDVDALLNDPRFSAVAFRAKIAIASPRGRLTWSPRSSSCRPSSGRAPRPR